MALERVPIIDISPFLHGDRAAKRRVVDDVKRICEDIGFLVIVGHGVPSELCARVFDRAREFFDLPVEEKLKIKTRADGSDRGYSPLLEEALSYSQLKLSPGDLKEAFGMGPPNVPHDGYHRSAEASAYYADNLWPERPAGLRAACSEYFGVMADLASKLLQIFALGLDLPQTYFQDKIDKPFSVFRVINYPSQPEEPVPGQLRAGEHTDYTTLTILRHESVATGGGLQVHLHNGEWADVPMIPDSLIVNLGDMLMNWTNDRWISTPHRVVNPPRDRAANSRRTSLVFFHEPNYDAVIECLPNCRGVGEQPKYPPILAGEYVKTRILRQVSFADAAG